MSVNELQVIAGFIDRAVCPEDVFGNGLHGNKKEQEEALKKVYRQLAKALHPDMHVDDPAALSLADTLFKQLEEFHKEAMARLKNGTYGTKKPLLSRAPVIVKGKYVMEKHLSKGDMTDVFLSSLESSNERFGFLLKVARTSDDNDLLRAEKTTLDVMQARLAKSVWKECIPKVVDSFMMDEGPGPARRLNVLNNFVGFYDGEEIRQKLPKGVDARTLAWMWKRLLVLMEWTHKIGYLHGAILPPHIMFFPDNNGEKVKDVRKHAIRLVDWCYSIEMNSRTRLSAWVPRYKGFYAPEILAKEKLGPYTDLYMGARTMCYLAGDDTGGSKPLPDLPKEIVASLGKCLRIKPENRPQSIGQYFEEFTDLLRKLYGPPSWHDFNL